jgi:dolichyl-diphosphooligosaccharide--protein glycosyltransferase
VTPEVLKMQMMEERIKHLEKQKKEQNEQLNTLMAYQLNQNTLHKSNSSILIPVNQPQPPQSALLLTANNVIHPLHYQNNLDRYYHLQNLQKNDYNLTSKQASAVVAQSHPSNPNNVSFVLSSDMIGKAGWWSYFGSWNFDTLNSTNYQYYMASDYVTINPNSEGNITVLNDGGILYNAEVKRGSKVTNTSINTSTTAQMSAYWDKNGSKVDLNGSEYNPLKASNLICIEDGYLTGNTTLDKNGNYTIYLLGSGNDYTAILMDNKLKDSVFTRLFLLGGIGQDSFELCNMQDGVSVWTVK